MKKTLFLLLCVAVFIHPKTEEEDESKQIRLGNLALPATLQPSPLFCFGQNVIDKNSFLFYALYAHLGGFRKEMNDMLFIWLYGITEKLSVELVIPIQLKHRLDDRISRHIEDIFPQVEYAFYNADGQTYANQATIVASLLLPTGSLEQKPPTGFGNISLFTGVTASHLDLQWYYFTAHGFLFSKDAKFSAGLVEHGLSYLYQFGLGRNIFGTPERGIFNVLFELFGTYSKPDKLNHITDPNSGGNIIYFAPSLWYSGHNMIIQVGAAFPIVQDLRGSQNKTNYIAGFQLTWKLH